MPLVLTFAIVPAVVFLALVALPWGKPAMIGISAAAALAVLATLATTRLDTSGVSAAIAMLSASAVALAGIVQALRHALGRGRPAWLYPLIVVAALVAAGWPLMQSLGI